MPSPTGNLTITPEFAALCDEAYALYGPGTGDRGYNQVTDPKPNHEIGTPCSRKLWRAVIAMTERCLMHQRVNYDGLLPLIKSPNIDVPLATKILQPLLDQASNERLLAWMPGLDSQMPARFARSQNWTGRISATVDVSHGYEDGTRALYNGAGALLVAFEHAGGTSAANTGLRGSLASLGTIAMTAHNHGSIFKPDQTPTGPGGYYDLSPTAPLTLFDGDLAGGHLTLTALTRWVIGERGGNGIVVRLTATLTGGAVFASGTSIVVGARRSNTFLRGIPVPVATLVSDWA